MNRQPAVPPNRAEASANWGARHISVGLAVGWLAVFVTQAVTVSGTGEISADDLSLEAISLFQIALWCGLLGVPIWLVLYKNLRWADLGLSFRISDVLSGFGLGALAQAVLVPILYAPVLFFTDELDVSGEARNLVEKADGFGVLLLFAVVVVGAPVIEELFFRGLAMPVFERRFGQRLGLFISAGLFGLVHLQLLQFPALFLFGLLVGWLVQRDGRLGRAIWAHVGFNAWTVGVLLWI